MSEPRDYTDDEVEAILRRALERQLENGEKLAHEDLVAAAREVGLDDAMVERAIAEMRGERSVFEIRRRLRSKRLTRWVRHLVAYLIVTAGLLALHALALAGVWVLYIAIAWGVLVALGSWNGLRGTTEEEVEREQVRLNRLARRKAEAEARREAARRKAEERARRKHERKHVGSELDRVIEEGVSLLLKAAANKLRDVSVPPRAPRTDFERFVAREKGAQRQGVPMPPPREPAKVRVETSPDDDEEELEPSRAQRRSTRKR